MWLIAILAAVVGITLGLLGGGGSILTVPVLTYVLDVPPKEAIATSLVVVGVTAAVAAVEHARRGRVRWRVGLLFSAAGMVARQQVALRPTGFRARCYWCCSPS